MSAREHAILFARRVTELGFKIYIARAGHYGFVTDETESRVLSFDFTRFEGYLGGNYGPPSTDFGTGWRINTSPCELKTAEDVKKALYAHPEYRSHSSWKYFVTVAQYLATYDHSSKFTLFSLEEVKK